MENSITTLFIAVAITTASAKSALETPLYEDASPDWHPDCVAGRFLCWNFNTIPCRWACDGQTDCEPLGEDEAGCDYDNLVIGQTEDDETDQWRCFPEDFKCTTHVECVPGNVRCDGRPDCYDGSDEWNCDNNVKPRRRLFSRQNNDRQRRNGQGQGRRPLRGQTSRQGLQENTQHGLQVHGHDGSQEPAQDQPVYVSAQGQQGNSVQGQGHRYNGNHHRARQQLRLFQRNL